MSSALERLAKRSADKPTTDIREVEIPLEKIRFDPTQPRKAFHHLDGRVAEKDEAYIAELAQIIDANGLIHAITVEEVEDGTYRVVVGECRTRAHMLLGRKTVRAVIRNDLSSRAKRLIYQLAENVGRSDLPDSDLAESIRELLKGVDGDAPMSQVQIAKHMGKSEGWVSRFVKFGDEELQRLWVKTGIADTVEKVYRLSILPVAVQVDIQRRVELPEGNIERLEKPLNRSTIDELARDAKIGKKKPVQNPPATNKDSESAQAGRATSDKTEGAAPNNHELNLGQAGEARGAAIDQALEKMAAEGQGAKPPSSEAAAAGKPKYQLSEEARNSLLGNIPLQKEGGDTGATHRDPVEPPVNCRVSVSGILALLAALQANEEVRTAFDGVQCSLAIPGSLAQRVANELTGIVVDQKEVHATVLAEMSKLQ